MYSLVSLLSSNLSISCNEFIACYILRLRLEKPSKKYLSTETLLTFFYIYSPNPNFGRDENISKNGRRQSTSQVNRRPASTALKTFSLVDVD